MGLFAIAEISRDDSQQTKINKLTESAIINIKLYRERFNIKDRYLLDLALYQVKSALEILNDTPREEEVTNGKDGSHVA